VLHSQKQKNIFTLAIELTPSKSNYFQVKE